MKLSLSTLGCPGWSWNEIFATAKDLGMNGIEVRGVANEMFAPAISVFNQGKRMETLERIEKSGMQLSMLTSGACLGGADSDKYMQEAKAYIDFAGRSAVELIDKYENLIVVQTFSKARSMAGMRIGYAISNPALIRYLNDVKYSFNSYTMDRTAIAAGVAAVEDKAYFDETCNKIIETREWTKKELKALGFSFQDSMSNFIFATHKTCPAKELFEALRGQHIYVRYFQKDRIDNFLRITVGTKEEMQKFIDFLKDYLK